MMRTYWIFAIWVQLAAITIILSDIAKALQGATLFN